MDQQLRQELAGFLTILARGVVLVPSHIAIEAGELLERMGQEMVAEESPCDGHVWRLNKHGRICVICLKIEEGKSPHDN